MGSNGKIFNPYDRPLTPGQQAMQRQIEDFSSKMRLAEVAWTEQAVRSLCPWWVLKSMDLNLKAPAKFYFQRYGFHIMHKDDGQGGRVHTGKWIIVWKEGQVRRIGHSYISGNQYLMQEATQDEYEKVVRETAEASAP